jgi:hypothetical protein
LRVARAPNVASHCNVPGGVVWALEAANAVASAQRSLGASELKAPQALAYPFTVFLALRFDQWSVEMLTCSRAIWWSLDVP